jgi:hypothetical protein
VDLEGAGGPGQPFSPKISKTQEYLIFSVISGVPPGFLLFLFVCLFVF